MVKGSAKFIISGFRNINSALLALVSNKPLWTVEGQNDSDYGQ